MSYTKKLKKIVNDNLDDFEPDNDNAKYCYTIKTKTNEEVLTVLTYSGKIFRITNGTTKQIFPLPKIHIIED